MFDPIQSNSSRYVQLADVQDVRYVMRHYDGTRPPRPESHVRRRTRLLKRIRLSRGSQHGHPEIFVPTGLRVRLEEIMEEAKPKEPLKGLAEGAAPSFPSGSKARAKYKKAAPPSGTERRRETHI